MVTYYYGTTFSISGLENNSWIKDSKMTKYIMFGDSITEHGNWSKLLNNIDVINKGISGDTTRDLLVRFDRSIDKNTNTVFLMVGINDIIQGRSVDNIFSNYLKILEKLQSLDITPIVQSTLFVGNDFNNLYPSINQNVEQLNNKLFEYCNENNIYYLDINQILAPNGVLLDQYTYDSVHINEKAYTQWSQFLISNGTFTTI